MDINKLLRTPKTIAVVGLSDNPERPSYKVASYLIGQGFEVIPVNPKISKVFEKKSYPNILAIPLDINIDIVDIFRKSEEVEPIIREVIDSGRKPVIWMQEGIKNQEAKRIAEENGMETVMDTCILKMHQKQ